MACEDVCGQNTGVRNGMKSLSLCSLLGHKAAHTALSLVKLSRPGANHYLNLGSDHFPLANIHIDQCFYVIYFCSVS